MKLPLLVTAFILFAPLGAETPWPPPAREAAQFDFWLGDWEVFTPDGKKAGENRIEKIAGGWGLAEHWSGAGGYEGKSLNTWEPHRRRWRQFWVGAGGALELSGGLNDRGEMVLEGATIATGGSEVRERIVWTPNPDGTVRQHWQQSADGGKVWSTVFDGLYRRHVR